MKIEKTKHDHTLTHLLKVGIFAMLMIAPLFAACSQWMYTTFNKNAKDSYYGETINEQKNIYVTNSNEFRTNKTYYTNTTNEVTDIDLNYGGSNTGIYVQNVKINNVEENSIKVITFYHNQTNSYHSIYFRNEQNVQVYVYSSNNPIVNTISFEYVSTMTSNTNTLNTFLGDLLIHEIKYNKYSYLSESFYYGVETMTESQLFNWTQNTALYTGIKAMTDNLEVKTNVIAVLVTYWTILTIIYIIIDIVLALFTKLTHLLVRSD